MKVVVLASGSEGNSTFFSSGGQRILLDIGKNAKYIKEKLKDKLNEYKEKHFSMCGHICVF